VTGGELVIRGAEVGGRVTDVRIAGGRIAAIGEAGAPPAAADELDARGGALIPGLADHHIHLFALAARKSSVGLEDVTTAAGFRARIEAAAGARAPGAWIRAVGYHERMAGELDREALDRLAPRHPLRIQHQTGALWVLNSAALTVVGADAGPRCVERGADGAPTGRIWRGDAWLKERLGAESPPLAPIGHELAAYGITSLTDASVTTDAAAAAELAQAHRRGELPQRLMLMSGGALQAPDDGAYVVGPVKVLLDDHDLPPLDDFVAKIAAARRWGRAVAVHCVTAGELALTLAAFETGGARPGDRIEHGGVIPAEAIGQIRAMGLAVVTQPAFVRERGDRYLAEVEPHEQADLYRCASLKAAGVPVAGSSDAPYASADPWVGVAAAAARTTTGGEVLGAAERIAPAEALGLYLGSAVSPATPRRVAVGADADLCLLTAPLRDVLAAPTADLVAATVIGGQVIFAAPGG
jgi:predicted amidohydrolase YtcJ